ncbi:N66 matrix protein-like [Senna tora]|uniref:N66 matrix protein-like n=1 Tax=Senna tora TaxID=362788 RepID=A0A834X4Q8_9FABA|nr:N66 matrix protein-like [Senna tora]
MLGNQLQPRPQAQAQGGGGSYSNNSGDGTIGSFNSGGGSQNFQGAKINSGAYSGDGNTYSRYDNYGGNLIHNSGHTNGNGNGSIVFGGFDSSTKK